MGHLALPARWHSHRSSSSMQHGLPLPRFGQLYNASLQRIFKFMQDRCTAGGWAGWGRVGGGWGPGQEGHDVLGV